MWVGAAAAVAVRYLLYCAGVADRLEEHLELQSPATSHLRLVEGLFLAEGGDSPYAGGACHHPPLLLIPLAWLRRAPALAHFTLLVALDLAAALLLRQLAVRYAAARRAAGRAWAEAGIRDEAARERAVAVTDAVASESSGASTSACDKLAASAAAAASGGSEAGALEELVSPAFVGLSYLFNPFVVASCLAQSMQSVHHVLLLGTVCLAASGRGGLAAGALAACLYVCPFTPVVLILPCAFLCFRQKSGGGAPFPEVYRRSSESRVFEKGFLPYLAAFSLCTLVLFLCLLAASAAAMKGRLEFLQASFFSILAFQDLTPNVGVVWYLFIEVFERYRLLFTVIAHAHLLFYPIPLHVKLGRHGPTGPMIQCGAAIALVSVFKPYPTASDYGLLLSVLLVQVELIREGRKTFAFLLSGAIFGLCMFPTMRAVWLTRNAGNANFLFNMSLVINIFACLLLCDWLKAGIRLRRRLHVQAFCRGVVLDALDAVLARPRGEASGAKGSGGASAADRGASARSDGGLRQRTSASAGRSTT
eukprot:TRINITY_DN25047_c0_g1_i1.p1 TRINITY_DN25047_c0_g1~~TRINITY_DN25047_c0_g1_i1.p1  ORF type:complete len:534 (-),score=111.52 TRINITY_DN25047_c0_g1_i1:34-1635(-)